MSSSSAATGAGHVPAKKEVENDNNEDLHHYQLRLVTVVNQRNVPTIKRAKPVINMPEDNKWPCWTVNLSALAFQTIQTHYTQNTGLRHKSTINLKKTRINFVYKNRSNYSWTCRQIVYSDKDFKLANRCSNPMGITRSTEEQEVFNFMGRYHASAIHHDQSIIEWDERYYNQPGVNQPAATPHIIQHTVQNLLQPPKHEKHHNTPFYWVPRSTRLIVYDACSDIPGKPDHLDSIIYVEKLWQLLPGVVQYKDEIQRGGRQLTASMELENDLNRYVTFIWQPDHLFSGEAFDEEEDTNALMDTDDKGKEKENKKSRYSLTADVELVLFWTE